MKQLFIKTNSSIYKRNSYFTERHTVKQLIGILIICKTYSCYEDSERYATYRGAVVWHTQNINDNDIKFTNMPKAML